MNTVLLINPNTSEATTEAMHRLARAALPAEFELESVTARRGVSMITNDAQMATAIAEVIAIGCERASRVSAIVVAAFGNPGLAQLRAAVSVPVFGIGEASMQEAAAGGRRFGVATTTPGLEASIEAAARALGLGDLFTGCRIAPGDPLRLAADPASQDARLSETVATCIAQDGAQCVVIGGGPLAASAERIAPNFAVPVISPIAAAMRAVVASVRPAA